MDKPLTSKRILFVSSDPSDRSRLRLAEERREISLELRIAGYDKIPMQDIGAARTSDIQRALLDFSPQIVHFSGHGTGSDGLVFQDLTGHSKLVNGQALANLFGAFSNEGLECVVLNACYSDEQAKLIAERVNFVVGMSEEIKDSAAIAFSVGFYQAIGAGRSVDLAYELGRIAIQTAGFPEHLTPVLYKEGQLVYEYQKPQIDEPPTICPPGAEEVTSNIAEACQEAYPEDIRLIKWHMNKDEDIAILFRERRRGWYFQMTLLENATGKWESVNRVSPLFLPLLQPDEFAWHKLTEVASSEDWYAMDEIVRLGLEHTESTIHLVNRFTVGEPVLENAMETFGIYVPDEHLLPAFLFLNKAKGLLLISYFKHPDGFAKENMLCDDTTNECRIFSSLKEAQKSLEIKLS